MVKWRKYKEVWLALIWWEISCLYLLNTTNYRFFALKNIYYGYMKPANILVFRDKRVKMGDLDISIKLDDDED